MRESVLELPCGAVGILTLPDATIRPTALILANAGRMHRTGPFRLHVELARSLAADGFAVLRLDAPGIGDASGAGNPPLAHLSEALDAMTQATGCHDFAVGGICAAADEAWMLARVDSRVRGLLLLDGIAARGFWYLFGRLLLALRRPPVHWMRGLTSRMRRAGGSETAPLRSEDYRVWPEAQEVRAQFSDLLACGLHVLALYTGGAAGYFAHPRQFAATFGAAAAHPHVRFLHWPEVDHLFFAPAARRHLYLTLRDWLNAWS